MRLPSCLPLGGGEVEAAPVDDCPPAPDLVARLVAFLDVFPVRDYWRRKGQLGDLESVLDHGREYVTEHAGVSLPKRRK